MLYVHTCICLIYAQTQVLKCTIPNRGFRLILIVRNVYLVPGIFYADYPPKIPKKKNGSSCRVDVVRGCLGSILQCALRPQLCLPRPLTSLFLLIGSRHNLRISTNSSSGSGSGVLLRYGLGCRGANRTHRPQTISGGFVHRAHSSLPPSLPSLAVLSPLCALRLAF